MFPSSQILSLGVPIVFNMCALQLLLSLGFSLFLIWSVQTINFVVGKISTYCTICSIWIVSGLKKDAVCLAIDHHQASCSSSRLVNTSKTSSINVRRRPCSHGLAFIDATIGERKRGKAKCILDLDNETLSLLITAELALLGFTMRKLTSWGFQKCCSFWVLKVLNQSYWPSKLGENWRKNSKERRRHKKKTRPQYWVLRSERESAWAKYDWFNADLMAAVKTHYCGGDFFLWHHLFLVTHPKFWQSGAMVSFIWPNLPLKHFRGPICRQKNQGVWFNLMWQNFLAESVPFRRLEQQTWKIFPHSLSSWTGVWSQST